jgi:hypothetical protein
LRKQRFDWEKENMNLDAQLEALNRQIDRVVAGFRRLEKCWQQRHRTPLVHKALNSPQEAAAFLKGAVAAMKRGPDALKEFAADCCAAGQLE